MLGNTQDLEIFLAGDDGIAAVPMRIMGRVCNDKQYNNISPSLDHPIGAYSMSIPRLMLSASHKFLEYLACTHS